MISLKTILARSVAKLFLFTCAFCTLQMDSVAASSGTSNNEITNLPIPPNDNCANAIELIPNSDWIETDNLDTVDNGPIPSCGGAEINDVWYYFTHIGGDIEVWFDNMSIPNGRLVIYDACNGNEIACSAFGTVFFINFLSEELSPGDYYIQASGGAWQTGSFRLKVDAFITEGCMDPTACNFNPTANVEDGSCSGLGGCTDPTAGNYNPAATCDNGLCVPTDVPDICETAVVIESSSYFVNMIPSDLGATIINGPVPSCYSSAIVPDFWISFLYLGGAVNMTAELENPGAPPFSVPVLALYDACGGNEVACAIPLDESPNPIYEIDIPCDGLEIGTTYYIQIGIAALAQGSQVRFDYLSITGGCMDPEACNFNPSAGCDNGSCQVPGCTYPSACNYDPLACPLDDSCVFNGCTDNTAINFDPFASCDDGTCLHPGCTNSTAPNYNPNATIDDGSCAVACTGDLNQDGTVGTADLLVLLSTYGTNCE